MDNTVVVRIQWWLGNQMFQYAYAYALSKRNWCKFLLDVSTFDWYKVRKNELSLFDNVPPYAKMKDIPFYERFNVNWKFNWITKYIRAIWWRLNPYDYRETSKWFEPKLADIKRWYVIGYFQTERYFQEYKKEVKKLFTFKQETEKKVSEYIEKHGLKLQHMVMLHVRRGDFQNDPNCCTISTKYYTEAKKKFFPYHKLLIFSDDVEWCEKNLKFPSIEIHYVDWLNWIESLCLMSKCHNFIISNSTFARWWAYLSDFDKKIVVRPDLEFDRRMKGEAYCRDHYPMEWIPFKW